MAEASLSFDPNIPRFGSSVTSKVLRDLLGGVATMNRGTSAPEVPAQIVGDVRFTTMDLTTGTAKYQVTITIDSTTKTDIDLGGKAANRSATTPEEVVTAINDAFSTLGTVAYTYEKDASTGAAFILLRSPTTGSSSTITMDRGTNDALDKVFGIESRTLSIPYTVTGSDPLEGELWYKSGENDSDQVQVFLNREAAVVGTKDLSSGVDLSKVHNLRIRIKTNSGTFGPYDVDCKGAVPSNTTLSEVVAAINAAFAGDGFDPASIHDGKYLKIVSGASANPDKGENTEIQISAADSNGHFIVDDACEVLLGLARGEGEKIFNRLPHTFKGSRWSTTLLRGVNTRTGPGIGPWGLPLEDKDQLPSTGVVDGEIRQDRVSGVPWVYNASTLLPGWRRGVPSAGFPVYLDKIWDRYMISDVSDDYVPEPLPDSSGKHLEAGLSSDVVTVIEARDSRWPDADTASVRYPDASRNLHLPKPRFDDFSNLDASALAHSKEGGKWTQSGGPGSRFISTTSGGETVAQYPSTGSPGTADRAIYHHPCGRVYEDTSADGSKTTFSGTLPIGSSGIIAGSIHVVVVSSTYVPSSTEGWSDRGSTTATITGTGISSGSVTLATGAYTITFTSPPASGDKVLIAYSENIWINVTVQVRKDPTAESRGSGNTAEAGIVYAVKNDSGLRPDTGYVVKVRDDGTGGLYVRTSSVDTLLREFTIDPPLDTEWRTLRVLFSGGSTGFHFVYWNGSPKYDDWWRKESSDFLSLNSDGRVANEQPQFLDPLIRGDVTKAGQTPEVTWIETSTVWPGNTFAGIYGKAVAASSPYGAKGIEVRNFQVHGGVPTSSGVIIPGLPPLSGARLRDILGAVRASDTSEVITDCSVEKPLIVRGLNDITLTQDTANRTLSFDFDFSSKHSKHDDLIQMEQTIAVDPFGPGGGGTINVDFDGSSAPSMDYDTVNYKYTALIAPAGYSNNASSSVPANGFSWSATTTITSVGAPPKVRVVITTGTYGTLGTVTHWSVLVFRVKKT